ncbi:MAG TPA: YwqG family protein [Ktedonobacterales bacterium]|jgi:uncharacterized protein YwqG|nr:YwqG family protein [Ktedonobacterales bacterium]
MERNRDGALYDALGKRLRANGLARVVDGVLALAQPAIRLDLTRATDDSEIAPGASKVGGEPDAPVGGAWPATGDGAPLPFLAQIRLADIAPFDPEGDLPHEGLLSFYYAMNDAEGELRVEDDPTAWRVIWTHDEHALLRRLATPEALIQAPDSRFPACAVTFTRRLTLPGVESPVIKLLGFTNDERLGYISVTGGADIDYLPEMDHRLLGFPYELEPLTFLSAYRAEHGEEPSLSGSQAHAEMQESRRALERVQEIANNWAAPPGGFETMRGRLRALHGLMSEADPEDMRRVLRMGRPKPQPERIRRALEARDRAVEAEWRLLFQLYSNDEARMDWAGGGVIHFGVKRAALAARDFGQVSVSLQFL